MSRENVDRVRAAWDAWERRDMDALFEFYDPEVVWDMTHSNMADLGLYHRHDGIRRFFREWAAQFDDFWAAPEEFQDAGDCVVVRLRQGGRGRESGARVEMPPYWQLYELRDGKAVRVAVHMTERDALDAAG
jgi:ketosteroid isomerase-like protein